MISERRIESLAEEIQRAFADTARPHASDITESGCCAECDELAAGLRERTWQDLLRILRDQPSDPDPSYLLRPAAFRYCAPAYLLAALLPGPAGAAAGRLVAPTYAFAPAAELMESFKSKYFPVFSSQERSAIVSYLRFVASQDTEEARISRERIEIALRSLWNEPEAP